MASPIFPAKIELTIKNDPPPMSPLSSLLDRVKQISGIAIALFGLAVLIGAFIALGACFTGVIALNKEMIHPFFLTGVTCTIGGFHLAKESGEKPSVEIGASPFTVSI